MSLLLVLFAVPLWLDPRTLSEVAGRATLTAAPATGLQLLSPRPDVPTPGPSPAASVIAQDEFDRTLSDTWGTADLGGAYTLTGTGALSVAQSVALVRLGSGDGGTAVLGSLGLRDASLEFRVSFDRLPVDGELIAYALLRVSATGAAYRMAIHLTSAGDVYAVAERVVGGRIERLGGQVLIPAIAIVGSGTLRVRADAVGDDPTTLRLRGWMDGAPEPAGWQLSTIDWTGTLQEPGAIGLGWQLDGAPAQSVVVGFSALTAWNLGGGE